MALVTVESAACPVASIQCDEDDNLFESSASMSRPSHWDEIFERERETGDLEEWYGERATVRMLRWVLRLLKVQDGAKPCTLLDVGTGNGRVLCRLAEDHMYPGHLLYGVDYSIHSIHLCLEVPEHTKHGISFRVADVLEEGVLRLGEKGVNECKSWPVGFGALFDKGALDAIAVARPPGEERRRVIRAYLGFIARSAWRGEGEREGEAAWLFVNSVNFTPAEVRQMFSQRVELEECPRDEGGEAKKWLVRFEEVDELMHESLQFGGVVGTTVSSLAYRCIFD
eukprot:TRINITY_DN15710_c0_g1_i1.p1 TRINITY_DN15710_c0_g1~~TRINITY_DN15710_c0_g1_i1.p1  ORF type:complete len:283 (+),score=64.94 TRINITY_DN15710_c0_g1_i1:144-992(+)